MLITWIASMDHFIFQTISPKKSVPNTEIAFSMKKQTNDRFVHGIEIGTFFALIFKKINQSIPRTFRRCRTKVTTFFCDPLLSFSLSCPPFPFFMLYLYAFLSIFGLSFFLVLFCSFFFVEFGRGLPRASGYPPASDFDDITQAPPLIYFLIFGLFCFVFYSFLFFFVYRR